jgi:hypothetical protein
MINRFNGLSIEGYKRPTPISISVSVNIITKYKSDLFQIYGNLASQFQPECFISWMVPTNDTQIKTVEELRDRLVPTYTIGSGEWLDVSGLIAPQSEIDSLVKNIAASSLTLKEIEQKFAEMYKNYYDYEWTWAYDKLLYHWGKSIEEIEIEDLIEVIEAWKKAVVALDKKLYNDAKKEFDLNSKTGFGVDGDESVRMRDFESVRGSFEENPFVKECLQHIERKTKLGNDTIELLKNICI